MQHPDWVENIVFSSLWRLMVCKKVGVSVSSVNININLLSRTQNIDFASLQGFLELITGLARVQFHLVLDDRLDLLQSPAPPAVVRAVSPWRHERSSANKPRSHWLHREHTRFDAKVVLCVCVQCVIRVSPTGQANCKDYESPTVYDRASWCRARAPNKAPSQPGSTRSVHDA